MILEECPVELHVEAGDRAALLDRRIQRAAVAAGFTPNNVGARLPACRVGAHAGQQFSRRIQTQDTLIQADGEGWFRQTIEYGNAVW